MSTTPVKSDQDFERKITVTQRSIQMNSSECFAFFGICLAIFTVFLAPSITSNDAGELGAAAFELGIAHPPGFPVFSMLVNGIMNLLGLGDFGFRGNFSSAVFGAAALSITFYTLRSRGIGMMEAWTFGLLTVFAPLFTVHMVTVEVYASAALTVSVSIELLLRYLERDDVRFLFLLALVLGIGGLGHHPMIRLVGICFAFFVLPKSKLKLGITVFGVSLFTGLLTLMYLPIRSNAHPNRDWGSPRTIDGLLDHVMGQRIRDSYADQMLAWDPEVFSSFASQLFTSSTVLLLFAVGSLAFTLREPLIKVFLALLALDIFYTVWINPMGVRDHQNGWLTTLMLFPIACLGFRRLKAQSHRLSSLVILLLVPTTVWSAATYASHEEFSSTNPWAKTLTKTMGRLAPESLILSASDSACSVLSFLQVTEANRPDIAVIVRQHAFRASSTEPTFKRLPVALSGWKPGASLTDLVHLSDEWPLAWEWIDGLDANIKPKTNVMIGPFMGRAQLSAPVDRHQWQTGVSNGLWSQRPNFVQSAVISEVAHAGLSKRASSPMLADVLKWWPENQFLWLRYTAQLTREQDFESAQNAVDAALTLFGKDPQFVEQKMRILIGKGLYAAALQLGGTLKAADVLQQANILGLMGICAANLKEYQQAKALFNQALELNPNQEESRLSLPRINSILRSNSP